MADRRQLLDEGFERLSTLKLFIFTGMLALVMIPMGAALLLPGGWFLVGSLSGYVSFGLFLFGFARVAKAARQQRFGDAPPTTQSLGGVTLDVASSVVLLMLASVCGHSSWLERDFRWVAGAGAVGAFLIARAVWSARTYVCKG
jgi:hypothetical protein